MTESMFYATDVVIDVTDEHTGVRYRFTTKGGTIKTIAEDFGPPRIELYAQSPTVQVIEVAP